ncbi:glycosyltransferase [Marinomonas ostreistagni]|uniref:Glycosyltransferase family 1 protein n=1 Tax=Marinomonas ostreistagni TaxID=359209 RepID=A0ABS0Z824_9GAMM|nr:glycosyltransferase [Marinomonas ostreistagni]MBJ7549141.1 glycosyltransferase family 1 protein [Marinomonas ostreistagni]
MNALFLIQNFSTKSLTDSAGYNEILMPFVKSSVCDQYEVVSWQFSAEDVHNHVQKICQKLVEEYLDTPVTVYGAGSHTNEFWSYFSSCNIVAFADSQSEKQGTALHGIPIIDPDSIDTEVIIISSRAWEASIHDELRLRFPNARIVTFYDSLHDSISVLNDQSVEEAIYNHENKGVDAIFYTPADPSEALTFEQLSRLKTVFQCPLAVVWWDYDDQTKNNPYTQFEKESLSAADLIIDPGNYTKTRKMRCKEFPFEDHPHVEKVAIFPTPANESVFFPRLKDIDIALFGSEVGLRGDWIRLLKSKYPDRFRHIGGVDAGKQPISMEEYAELSGRSKIIVNTQTYTFRSQCKGKVREALASGALLLEQDSYDTRAFLGGLECVKFFKNEDELIELIDFYLENEPERERLAQEGYEWYLAQWGAEPWSKKIRDRLMKG